MPFDTFTVPEPEIERALSAGLGRPVRVTGLSRLAGGMINSVLLATLDTELDADGDGDADAGSGPRPNELVLKLSENPAAFAREARLLRWLRERTEFPVPAVRAEFADGFGLLALERLEGVNLGRARATGGDFRPCEREMAEAVAALHAHTRDTYGDPLDGERFPTWVEAFRGKIGGFDDPKTRERLDAATLGRVAKIVSNLERILPERPPARLVHGDIWATNVIVRPDASGRWHLTGFVDVPGTLYADTEYELAYLLVFNTAGRAFFERYSDFFELAPGFEFRRLVYHLHTMLVHVYCFGDGHYRRSARELAKRVAEGAGLE